jgi:hypothetical protein
MKIYIIVLFLIVIFVSISQSIIYIEDFIGTYGGTYEFFYEKDCEPCDYMRRKYWHKIVNAISLDKNPAVQAIERNLTKKKIKVIINDQEVEIEVYEDEAAKKRADELGVGGVPVIVIVSQRRLIFFYLTGNYQNLNSI